MIKRLHNYHFHHGGEFIIYNCQHFGAQDFDNPLTVNNKLHKDVRDAWGDLHRLSNSGRNRLIINFLFEGSDPSTSKQIIDIFKEFFDPDHMLAFYNAAGDSTELDHRIVICPWAMANHEDISKKIPLSEKDSKSLQLDRKILCLMRRPSWSRAKFAYALTNSVDRNFLRISFGTLPSNQTENYQSFFNTARLPLLINGIAEYDIQHNQSDLLFHTCLFNAVVETSSQTDQDSWRTKFITEKTFKAFLLRQIPIWFAVPGLVAEIRKLGFDLFDDIIDHRYDLNSNEHQRITSVTTQLSRLDQTLNLQQCQQLRNDLWSRLNRNFELAMDYAAQTDNFMHEWKQKFIIETRLPKIIT